MSKQVSKERKVIQALLKWYRGDAGRELPWRNTRDPYEIWVSEILLQQTQVSRVIDYYERFLTKFPNIESLAKANWRQLLPVWRGLGYYSRGKNMLKTARVVVDEHGGEFPSDYDSLVKLPGIGPYTANAILSFAFNKRLAAVDTNLKRVGERVFGDSLLVDILPGFEKARKSPGGITNIRPENKNQSRSGFVLEPSIFKCRAYIQKTLFDGHRFSPRDLNYALMDLGATLCKARRVQCELCPLQSHCDFRKKGKKLSKPQSKPQSKSPDKATKTKVRVDVGVACIHRAGKYLLCKRPKSKGGEWEFPGGKREAGESIRDCIKREIQEELNLEVSVRPEFLTVELKQRGKLYRLHFCRCQILRGKERALEHQELFWGEVESIAQLRLAASNRSVLDRLRKF